jgi:hypothetical protein
MSIAGRDHWARYLRNFLHYPTARRGRRALLKEVQQN